MTKGASGISVVMRLEKETKGTYRYHEIGNEPMIGTLYIPKRSMDNNPPESITVDVAWERK